MTRSREVLFGVAVTGGVMLMGLYLVAPHLGHEVWYDESYTILNYALGGVTHPFLDYSAPNNHVVFSAMLAAWKDWVLPGRFSVLHLRMLPLLFFMAAILLTIAVVARLSSRALGLLAGIMFATCHVTLNFALELRGYGVSWVPIVGAWLALSADIEKPRWWKAGLYAACCFVAIGILPTNLMALAVICAWASVMLGARAGWALRSVLARILFVCVVPFTGMLNYAGVWRELMRQAGRWNQAATIPGIMRHWYWATLGDLWWLTPMLLVSALMLVRQARAGDWSLAGARSTLLLAGCLVVVPPLCMWVLKHPPYPRNLVPLLPVWCGCVCLLLKPLAELRPDLQRAAGRAFLPLLGAVLIILAAWREQDLAGFSTRNPAGSRPLNTYDQYYQYRFHPSEAVKLLREMCMREPTIVFTDNSDLWALIFATRALYPEGMGAPFMYFKDNRLRPALLEKLVHGRKVVVIACNLKRTRQIIRHLWKLSSRPQPFAYKPLQIADTGFFKIYAVEARSGKHQHAAHGRQAIADGPHKN